MHDLQAQVDGIMNISDREYKVLEEDEGSSILVSQLDVIV